MGRKATPGLYRRGKSWHIDKIILGKRVCESTGTDDLEEAERHLSEIVRQRRELKLFGTRPRRSFSEALARYFQERSSTENDAYHCGMLDKLAGHLDISEIHMGIFQPFIRQRQKDGVKTKTINLTLSVARAVLNKAAAEWFDETGKTWLQAPPKIKLLRVTDAARAYPLSWNEERELFSRLPVHYQRPCLYGINTGLRQELICGLKWEWEHSVPEIERTVFLVPGNTTGVKNGEDWLVVHNRIAQSVIDSVRGNHPEYVFGYKSDRLYRLNNTAWHQAWRKTGLPTDARMWRKGVHNLRHTFGHRLRAAGVSNETRHALLHHKSRDMSTHYSIPEIRELVEAVDRLCEAKASGMTVLRLVG
ncbi:MAG: tyrosine-type recombinase/integrase [Terriglobia bacterium]